MVWYRRLRTFLSLFLATQMILGPLPVHALQTDSDFSSEMLASEGLEAEAADVPAEEIENVSDEAAADGAAAAASGEAGEDDGLLGIPAAPPGVSGYTGAATYRVPIAVPPGRAGIGPNLSLTYISQGRNGLLGVGWSLDLGSIQRRTKNGLRYDVNDYDAVINGSQIELTPRPDWGPDTYGSRIEGSFMRFRVTARDASQQPVSWEVTTKEGTRYFYGSASSSRQVATGLGTFKWCLDRVEDLNGNFMSVSYALDTTSPYPVNIQYTGWKDASGQVLMQPTNSIELGYDQNVRVDRPISYGSYRATQLTRRLISVLVYGNGQLASRYSLVYDTPSSRSHRSLLRRIDRHETAQSSTPIVSSSFEYVQGNNGFGPDLPFGSHTGDFYADSGGFKMADVNGDGRADLIYACSGCSNQIRVLLANGTGFGSEQSWGTHAKAFLSGSGGFQMADMNGDGRADFVYCSSGDKDIHVLLSSGAGFSADGAGAVWGTRVKNFESTSAGFRLADVNADGLPDFIYDSVGDRDLRVLLTLGTGRFGTESIWGTRAKGYHTASPGLRLADMNGDGRADVVYDSYGEADIHVLLANATGNGFRADAVWGSRSQGYNEASPGIRMADVNGDGLSDVVYDSSTGRDIYVMLSTGRSLAADAYWGTRARPYNESCLGGFRMADVNGDGMADLVYDGGDAQVMLSTGRSFRPDAVWQTIDLGYKGGSKGFQLADATGDGLPELIYVSPGTSSNVRLLKSMPFPDLLKVVRNGIGGTHILSYQPSSAYANALLPYVVQTVSSIASTDGISPTSWSHYTYSGGYHHPAEREFRGFQTVTQSPGSITLSPTTTTYFQDRKGESPLGLKGLPSVQTVNMSSSQTYKVNRYTYQVRTPYTGVLFPCLTTQVEELYDGAASPKTTQTDFDYDAYGNVILKDFKGYTTVTGDERREVTTYVVDTANRRLSLPETETVSDPGGPPGNIAARTRYEYEPGSTRVSKTIRYLDGVNDPATLYTYEKPYGGTSTGNVETVRDPNGNVTTTLYDATRTFPATVINPLGHQLVMTYDYRFGKVKTRQDPNHAAGVNDHITRYEYDALGRVAKVIAPEDYNPSCPQGVNCWTRRYEYSPLGVVGTQKVKVSANERSGGSGSLWKEVYFDGFGREMQTRAEGPEGKVIATLTNYDSLGRVASKSLPHFEGIEAARYVTFHYDNLGRVTRKTNPDGTYARRFHLQGKTTFVDEKSHVRAETVDAHGRLAKVEECTGTYPGHVLYAATSYHYDIQGNLSQVVDAQGNVTSMVYDRLSRKVEMHDPDMGHWQYTVYDGNGNLREQRDANGNLLSFDYDALNRLTRKTCGTCTPETTIDVTCHYDEGPPGENGKGRLTRVEDASGVTRYGYDRQGRVKRTVRTVNGIEYTSGATFDALGRMETVTYPHRQGDIPETLTHTHDAGGNLSGTWFDPSDPEGYVALHSGYNALGQVGTVTHANGVTTEYTYDPQTRRLQSIVTTAPPPASRTLRYVSYAYDAVGNITDILDHLAPEKSQVFEYDDLNRLTAASSNAFQPPTITYAYDKIGNMTSNTRVGATTYASPRGQPHAVTRAGSDTFEYDANGNMVKKNGGQRTLAYDAENRVKRITTGGASVTFVYDHKGERVKKIQGGVETVYIGGLLEIRGSEVRKHYAAGGKKIATRIGSTLYNTHGDHLGSLSLATDEAQPSVPRQETVYYPFGETASLANGVGLHHKFTDQEEDPETGLYYYGARNFSKSVGSHKKVRDKTESVCYAQVP